MTNRTAAFIAILRRRMLAYKYDFNTEANARIISNVRDAIGDHLEDTNDDARTNARTVAHYLAQLALRPIWSKWLFELIAIPALPLFLMYAGFKGLVKNKRAMQAVGGVRLIFPHRFRINPEIFCIPDEIEGAMIATRPIARGFLLGRDIWRTLQLLAAAVRLKTPFPIQLALKCGVDLSKVREALNGLTPEWVIVYWEFSCALSFVNGSLRENGVATYNVMHGEKNFYAKHAFFEVTRCYCWDSYYIDLFRKECVRADFRAFRNPAFEPNKSEESNFMPTGIGLVVPDPATLSTNPRDAKHFAKQIATACNELAGHHDLSVRPHPIYNEGFHALRPFMSLALKIVTAEQENARTFILRRELLIGTNSTMLLEAARLGRKVIMLNTPATSEQERHHYIDPYPNVMTCSIDALTATVVNFLNQSVSDRFPQPVKTDTDRDR